jgi:hypothetical protein
VAKGPEAEEWLAGVGLSEYELASMPSDSHRFGPTLRNSAQRLDERVGSMGDIMQTDVPFCPFNHKHVL